MVADKILKNFQLFVSAKGYAGKIEEFTPPKLAIKTEDYQAAGMDAPIALDVGTEKLETSFTLTGYDADVISLWGIQAQSPAQLVAKGALQDLDGTVTPVEIVMQGKLLTVEPDAWKPAAQAKLKITANLNYFKWTQGGTVLHEIDVFNCKRVVNGVDQMAGIRGAIGL